MSSDAPDSLSFDNPLEDIPTDGDAQTQPEPEDEGEAESETEPEAEPKKEPQYLPGLAGVPDAELVGEYVDPGADPTRPDPQSFQEHCDALERKVDLLFDQIDTDHDGSLSNAELSAHLTGDDELEYMMLLAGRSMRDMFAQLDTDKDGRVTHEEFQGVLGQIGATYSIAWLEEQILYHKRDVEERGLNTDFNGLHLGTPAPAWCLVFVVEKNDDGKPTNILTHETVELVQKMWKLDLSVTMHRSIDRNEVLILVGIPFQIMAEEAAESGMRMRLREIRGTMPFDSHFHGLYRTYTRHGLVARGKAPEGEGADTADETGAAATSGDTFETIFISAHHQEGIIQRLRRNGVDLDFRMRLPKVKKLLQRSRKTLNARKKLRSYDLKELLTGVGGFRERNDQIMGDHVAQLARCVLADPFFSVYSPEVLALEDKKGKLARTQGKVMQEHMAAAGLPAVEYDLLLQVMDTLEAYYSEEQVDETGKVLQKAGPGLKETYIGSLDLFIPMHNAEELSYLRAHWGSWNWAWKLKVEVAPIESGRNPLPLGHPDRTLETIQFGFLYQPLDDVRDYFGDDNGMYFSWLGTYTKALVSASVLGVITMFGTIGGGVDDNPLTVYYSMFLSVWSVVFLSSWKRQEAEHAFLWGSEGFEDAEEARPEFRGLLVVNEETGKEDLIYGAVGPRLTKKLISIGVIATCMILTVFGALTASSLKYMAPAKCNAQIDVTKSAFGCTLGEMDCCYCLDIKDCPGYNGVNGTMDRIGQDTEAWDSLGAWVKFKWPGISAALNLSIIISAGIIYESIAEKLNDMENFRTNTEYSDGIIIKNFLFQFVNNYFVLFYIAYLRQIEIMGTKKECYQSCLSELNIQMMVVFTGKTFGLQLVELAKPFVAQKIALIMETSGVKATANFVVKGFDNAAAAMMSEKQKIELGIDEESMAKKEAAHELQQRREEREDTSGKITNIYELQTHKVNYEEKGTFDDFNEMAIQYGYIALFSPCFPLAPFFAFLNNVFEIRGDSWKLCKAYQRPTATQCEDIGSWFTVLNILGFVAVMTNATMIAFVGSQLTETAHEMEGIGNRAGAAHLWVRAVGIEHGVILVRVVLLLFLPTYPSWIGDAKDVLRFRQAEMKRQLRNASRSEGRDELAQKGVRYDRIHQFLEADKSRNNTLDRDEFVRHLGTEQDFDRFDENNDGVVNTDEFQHMTGESGNRYLKQGVKKGKK